MIIYDYKFYICIIIDYWNVIILESYVFYDDKQMLTYFTHIYIVCLRVVENIRTCIYNVLYKLLYYTYLNT